MVNNKPTSATFTHLLLLHILVFALAACASAPPAPEPVEPIEPVMVEPIPVEPTPVVVQRAYPDRYVVKRGDTLWDISKRFLKDPWVWPEVWHINPRIRNPHLIYPGDVIVLYYDDEGRPYITLEGAAGVARPPRPGVTITAPEAPTKDIKTVKLSPQIRYESLDKAISTIPRTAIAPFLQRPRVVTEDEIEDAPYIVSSFEEHLVSGTNYRIYANDVKNTQIGAYDIIRPGVEYEDPESGDALGFEVIKLADARVLRGGEPTTLTITKAYKEVLNGDLLLPTEEQQLAFNFFPRPPSEAVNGQIISVFDGVSLIGQYNVVVLNKGERDGLKPGHVLAIYQKGARVRDPGAFFSLSTVQLPDERGGLLMVFRTYEKVSYGLIIEAYRALHVFDRVTNP